MSTPCTEFCILDFGPAFNNPVTDDTNTWVIALSHLKAIGGGTLHLPRGTSRTSQKLSVGKNTTIVGQGQDATKLLNAASDVFQLGFAPEGPVRNLVSVGET